MSTKRLELELIPLQEWLPFDSKPVLIAGPCSAESEDQLIKTALGIKKYFNQFVFRAGIWKPRTRPGQFEGIGVIGLDWMKRVKEETGAWLTTEVANPMHIEKALKNGIDILWIGARTTVNPFSVQELANALRGVDVPVLIKNPAYPDLQLWIGALERFNRVGIKKMATVHRGFHSYEVTAYRNQPQWETALELKTMCPELPMICDPSHICGNTHLTAHVSQKAMDLHYDGLMIETHIDPLRALSDARQQITPDRLYEIISNLVIRDPLEETEKSKLQELRDKINELDEDLLQTLSSRMLLSKEIGDWKRDNNVIVFQVSRWEEVLKKVLELGENLGLKRDFVKQLYMQIHDESIRTQVDIMNITSKDQPKGEVVRS
ncbi:MAG: bifunctional 3-deoxy-7-phosphoheptulonate synthase/chorismate mutase type II [Chitinophagales bacterium]|nr:bifunctional 3-deoxy-7-phosphoheptulonate synthase/chorismate mutase type II [Chitinophagales bacterium]